MEKYLTLLSFGPEGWGLALLQGAWITISIALATVPFGLTLGLLVALGKALALLPDQARFDALHDDFCAAYPSF